MLLMAVLCLALAFSLGCKRLRTVLLCLLAAAAMLLYLTWYQAWFVSPVRQLSQQTLTISATLQEDATVYEDGEQRARLRVAQDDAIKRAFSVYCYLPPTDDALHAGDRVTLSAYFYLPSDTEGFDRAVYQAANGCFLAARYATDTDGNAISFSYEKAEFSLRYLPQQVLRQSRTRLQTLLPTRESGLLQALLFGTKDGLSDDDYLALRKAGMSHMVAVSGLHIGFLVGFCYLLFGRRWGTVASIPLILCFVPIAGATPSVCRAAIMYLIAAGGFCLKKQADSLNSLFLALGLLLLQNPYAIFSVSLQLSFAATLGLILFAGRMQRRLMQPFAKRSRGVCRLFSILAGAISCAVCSMLLTTPILLSSFGYVSLLSIISNLLALPVTAICFIGGFVLCLIASLSQTVAGVLAQLLAPLLRYLLSVAERTAALPFGLVRWDDVFGVAALLLFFAGVLVWLLLHRRRAQRVLLGVCCIGVLGATALGAHDAATRYSVTYLPCDSGQAILVSTADELLLIDCSGGGSRHDAAADVREWMLLSGFDHIDTLVLTAVDKGHARDLPSLLEQTRVDRILIPDGCKETQHNTEILAALAAVPTETVSTEVSCGSSLPVRAFPITDGKLCVQIGTHTLVLHSPTQKQLAAYLAEHSLHAERIVLGQNRMEDTALLRQAIAQIGAQSILVQSGVDPIRRFDGIPVESPHIAGEIRLYYRKE